MQICSSAIDILGNTLSIVIFIWLYMIFVQEKHEVLLADPSSANKLQVNSQNMLTSTPSQ